MNWKNEFPLKNRVCESKNGILYGGDCEEVLADFPSAINLIVTSPPYNVGIPYEGYNDELEISEYFLKMKRILILFKKVLRDDGRFVINLPYAVNMKLHGEQNRISPMSEFYSLLKEVGLGFHVIVDLHEAYPNFHKLTAWGSWLSARAPYIMNPKEGLLIGYNKQWKREDSGVSTISEKEFIELSGGVWKYSAQSHKKTEANFSLQIPYMAIQGFSFKDDLILDPFIGSGTTALECEKLGRRWIGIEISEKYVGIAKDILSQKNLISELS